jgi:hypothetical protein
MADMVQPDVVGNYLAAYNSATDRRTAAADRQRNMQRQDVADQHQARQFDMQMDLGKIQTAKAKLDALNEILSGVDPANEQSLLMAKQRYVQTFNGKPEDVANITMADIPRIKMQTGQTAAELDLQYKRAQIAAANRSNQGGGAGGSTIARNASERAQLAATLGIDPRSDAGKRYILTGQMPNGLTAGDRAAVQDADQKVVATSGALDMLKEAATLSEISTQGFGSETFSAIGSLVGDKVSTNTINFDNLLKSNVLPQLKTIFGGSPTEGERAILLELQGSSNLSREARLPIIKRAYKAAEKRLQFYKSQAEEIRGGTYYNPGKGPQAAEQMAPPVAAAPARPRAVPPPPPGFKVNP